MLMYPGKPVISKIFLVLFMVLSMSCSDLNAEQYKPGEVIVKFKPQLKRSVNEEDAKAYLVAVDDTEQAIKDFSSRSDVEYVEPNYIIRPESVPDDWSYGAAWSDIEFPPAWDYADLKATGQSVKIALIDTGVDLDHPELQYALLDGYDFANNDREPEDETGHGTKVCGVIAAKGNNATGSCGAAWDINVKIIPLKFMKVYDGEVTGYVSDAILAIDEAISRGVKIINASWGFDAKSQALEDAIARARDNGILFVCSVGNSGENNDETSHWPSNSALENVISVAGMAENGTLSSSSNYGIFTVDIVAPGESIFTTIIGGYNTNDASGTSFAAPFVSSVAALILSMNPNLGYARVKEMILAGTNMNYSDSMIAESGGCLNAYNAVTGTAAHTIKDTSGYTSLETSVEDLSAQKTSGCMVETSGAGSDDLSVGVVMVMIFALLSVILLGKFRRTGE